MENKWKNKVVELKSVDPSTLTANASNFRRHPRRQRDILSASIGEVGYIGPVVVNHTTGNIIDGHLRVELAIDNKESTIPVVYVELTENEEKIALATYDPISALAYNENETYQALLASISTESEKLKEYIEQQKTFDISDLSDGDMDDNDNNNRFKKKCPSCGFIY